MIHIKRAQLFVVGILLVFAGCQKIQEDKIPPVIKLIGNNPEMVLEGCNYNESGAKVADDKPIDPNSFTIEGEVNVDSAGVYFLDYTAFDADSNRAFEQRMVIVEAFDYDFYEGNFAVTDTLLTVVPRRITNYQSEISWVSQNQKIFKISNFSNLGEDFEVLIQPDSTGHFQITYDQDTISISGQGWIKCNLEGLRMIYNVELPEEYQSHKATYKK
jgi:hypothetical protein